MNRKSNIASIGAVLVVVMMALLPALTLAFVPSNNQASSMPSTSTSAATSSTSSSKNKTALSVKFDKTAGAWVTESPEETAAAGYGVWGALVRFGPKPALARLLGGDDYEQGVLKFMAAEKCTRAVAEGNMDAFCENPNDWLEVRQYEAKNPGFVKDYVTVDTKGAVLRLAWVAVLGYVVYDSLKHYHVI